MSAATYTYRAGVATIVTATRMTEVNVAATADLFVDGFPLRPTRTDALALALGYRALAAENKRLTEELAAARAGTIGREHAEAMHGARKVIAELHAAVGQFIAIYDEGNAPDSTAEGALRNMWASADAWLLRDVSAWLQRAKLLKDGAA